MKHVSLLYFYCYFFGKERIDRTKILLNKLVREQTIKNGSLVVEAERESVRVTGLAAGVVDVE